MAKKTEPNLTGTSKAYFPNSQSFKIKNNVRKLILNMRNGNLKKIFFILLLIFILFNNAYAATYKWQFGLFTRFR